MNIYVPWMSCFKWLWCDVHWITKWRSFESKTCHWHPCISMYKLKLCPHNSGVTFSHDFCIPWEFDFAWFLMWTVSGWIFNLCIPCTAFWALPIYLMMEEDYQVDIETSYSIRFDKGKLLSIPAALLVEDMGYCPNSHHLVWKHGL